MLEAERVEHAQQILAVCNACRYCEQFCPVFPAIERRTVFAEVDLHYLANLCHNCGECLYACQYAPPHPFGVNVPRTLAEGRRRTYQEYCWPPALAAAFERNSAVTALLLTVGCAAALWLGVFLADSAALSRPQDTADFYAVVPHGVLVTVFGVVAMGALAALGVSLRRYWRDLTAMGQRPVLLSTWRRALADAASLRHLHGGGVDCTTGLDDRTPWRRWAHHATAGGFGLCLASTTVAAAYHAVGWQAPHAYLSVPVVLGTAGGLGLVGGPLALLLLRASRDEALGDPSQRGLDQSLLVLLLVTAATGLALLVFRSTAVMGPLLLVHLGAVLAFFITIPYSKFVHGFYRLLALVWSTHESVAGDP